MVDITDLQPKQYEAVPLCPLWKMRPPVKGPIFFFENMLLLVFAHGEYEIINQKRNNVYT